MLVELALAFAQLPVATVVAEGVRHHTQLDHHEQQQYRMTDFRIDVYCSSRSRKREQVNRTMVVLKNQKTKPEMFERLNRPPLFRGLVSTISDDPPTLNWVFIDKRTLELKYGTREQARGHILGPWDWTDDEVGLVMEEWEGFVAVEEERNVWAVYYDRDDDGLKKFVDGKRVLQCSLERRVVEEDIEDFIRR